MNLMSLRSGRHLGSGYLRPTTAQRCLFQSSFYKPVQSSTQIPRLSQAQTSQRFFYARGSKRGTLKRRLLRRLFFSGCLLGLWGYYVDADFVTYFYDLYHEKYPSNFYQNKTIWIVGASSGIGEYLTYEIANNNAEKIIISSRRQNELERVKQNCHEINPKCQIIVKPFDLLDFIKNPNDSSKNDKFIDKVLLDNGDIDILILNSGLTQTSLAINTELNILQYLTSINLFGVCSFATSMIREWKNNNFINDDLKSIKNKKIHSIAVTSSISGKIGTPGGTAYSATKHGINGYFEGLRMEHFNDNININIICPGPIAITESSNDTLNGDNINNKIDRKKLMSSIYKEKIMSTSRCAQLYATAISYNIGESWISPQPVLAFCYLRQYFPIILGPLQKLVGKSYMTNDQKKTSK